VSVSVRRAVTSDRAALAGLLSQLQAHYRSPDPPGGADGMARLLTREGEHIPFALIAEVNGKPVGLATLTPVLFGGAYQWLLYLKDLFVSTRSKGVGAELMRAIARTALESNYVRVDWTTDTSNDGAQRFYDGLGVPRQGKVNYRLAKAELERLAK
jgi:GNAT superfamily N-acetyltransferase